MYNQNNKTNIIENWKLLSGDKLLKSRISYTMRTKTEAINLLERSMKKALKTVNKIEDLTYFGSLNNQSRANEKFKRFFTGEVIADPG
jgi:nucleoid DNA-binding protein